MAAEVLNKTFTTHAIYLHNSIGFCKPIANKIVETAKKCLEILCQFVGGFCTGAAAAISAIIFTQSPIGHSLDPNTAALCSLVAGIFVGIERVINSWNKN